MLRFILVVACLFIFSCQKKSELTQTENERSGVSLIFSARNGADSLIEGLSFSNPFNESFSVSGFRFYIHNIELIHASGDASTINPEHFLVDCFAGRSTIKVSSAPGDYTAIRFIIGVDSARNFSGAQTGALDPANGMFWTWKSGYIMAKLEGTSPVANTANNKFEFHIGGYKPGESVIRTVELRLPGRGLTLTKNGSAALHIHADVARWFDGPFKLRIAEHPVISTPGPLAVQVADNYRSMFDVISVTTTE